MEQPDTYNNGNELINWLIYDLEEQRKEIAKDRGISKDDVKDEELVLHIGDKNKDSDAIDLLNQQYTTYNIYFNLNIILSRLDNNEIICNDKSYQVCKYRINARHCIFNFDVSTFNVIFKQEVNFFNSKFKNNKNNIDSFFLYCNFENRLIFYNCSFYNNFNFYSCLFCNEVRFNNSKFYSDMKFNRGYINDKIKFNNSFIQNNLVISCNTVNNINLDNISFENSKSLLSIKYITNTIEFVSLKDIYMNGRINFYNIKIKNINLQGTSIIGDFSDINCEYDNLSNWQTARILKHEEYKKSNSIKALEYHAEETKLYKKELLNKPNKTIKDFGDIFSINLSSFYSDNGLNWIKSFICTILSVSIFFTLSYIPTTISIFAYILFIIYLTNIMFMKDIAKYIINSILVYVIFCVFLPNFYLNESRELLNIDFLKGLIRFFIPTNFEDIINTDVIKYKLTNINILNTYEETKSYIYKNNNILEIIIKSVSYFIGKIAFWYGSVQTVQSFRKFSKKE